MEDPNTQSRVVMGPIIGLMRVDVLVRCLVVDVLLIVDLDSSGSRDRPEADSDQKEPNKKLGPRRPGPDVYEAPQEKSHASNNDHADAMSQTQNPPIRPAREGSSTAMGARAARWSGPENT